MQAPKCRTCGKPHWGPVCDAPAVTRNAPVTPSVTRPVTGAVTGPEGDELRAEVAALLKRVAALERATVPATASRPASTTNAARQRAYRARKKAAR